MCLAVLSGSLSAKPPDIWPADQQEEPDRDRVRLRFLRLGGLAEEGIFPNCVPRHLCYSSGE